MTTETKKRNEVPGNTMPARSWCFTLFNENSCELTHKHIRYAIYQKERCPNTQKEHLQGYIEFSKTMRLTACKKILPTAHWEIRKGTREQARDYCRKQESRIGDPVEIGNWESGGQGARTDLYKAYEMITKDHQMVEILHAVPETYIKYSRGLEKAKFLIDQEKSKEFRQLETTVIWGASGVGKTRSIMETEKNIYKLNAGEENLWFDGYNGEETLLLDEFYGGIKYSKLLELLDGYQTRLPIKGGFTWARWKKVFITSNKAPEEWYSKGMTPALARRLHKVVEVPSAGGPSGHAVTTACVSHVL